MKYFQKIRHVDRMPKTDLPKSHQDVFWHDARKLGIENGRNQSDGDMVPAELSVISRCCADGPGIAYPYAFAAPNTLADKVDQPFARHANGFGRTGTDTGGMTEALSFIEFNKA